MMLTGKPVDATEAYRIGLVNHVVTIVGLLDFSRELLGSILENSTVAAACIMECVDVGLECGIDAGQRFEAASYAAVSSSEDRREGTRAFLEKRRPVFQGK
jgi:enoyl-CoA hydratase